MVLEIKDLIKDYYHKEKKIEVLKKETPTPGK